MKNKSLGHLMVDIETLGQSSGSVILSISAVEFCLDTGKTGRTFTQNICIQSCLDLGLKIDGSTIEWWFSQDEAARIALFKETIPLPMAILHFWSFYKNLFDDEVKVWGNGSRFDLGIIADAFKHCCMILPWKYSNERDVRTLVGFAPEIKASMPFDGIKHIPIDDCMHQIKYCWKTYQYLLTGKR